MPTGFTRAIDVLLEVSKAHGALFLFGPGLTMAVQRSLKPAGHCGALERVYYLRAIVLSILFAMAAFGSYIASSFVRSRVPDAADGGGLQSLGARERAVLRAYAAVAFVLNVAASVLALSTYLFILETKVGMVSCLPAPVRVGIYGAYAVISALLCTIYAAEGKALFGQE